MLKEKLSYFFENHSNDRVFSTSDEMLFTQKQDAVSHSKTLEKNEVLEHLRSGADSVEADQDEFISDDDSGLQNKAQEVAEKQQNEANKKQTSVKNSTETNKLQE